MTSGDMEAKVGQCPTPSFVPIINFGRKDPNDYFLVPCERIVDIKKLRPQRNKTQNQMRVEFVKGFASHLKTKKLTDPPPPPPPRACCVKFLLYDGSEAIHNNIWDDSRTHHYITSREIRE